MKQRFYFYGPFIGKNLWLLSLSFFCAFGDFSPLDAFETPTGHARALLNEFRQTRSCGDAVSRLRFRYEDGGIAGFVGAQNSIPRRLTRAPYFSEWLVLKEGYLGHSLSRRWGDLVLHIERSRPKTPDWSLHFIHDGSRPETVQALVQGTYRAMALRALLKGENIKVDWKTQVRWIQEYAMNAGPLMLQDSGDRVEVSVDDRVITVSKEKLVLRALAVEKNFPVRFHTVGFGIDHLTPTSRSDTRVGYETSISGFDPAFMNSAFGQLFLEAVFSDSRP